MSMREPRTHLVVLLLLAVSFTMAVFSVAASITEQNLEWISTRPACHGTIADCLEAEEFELGVGTSRRILATAGYIGYDALRRDSVPCSLRGTSYYNCRAGAEANPYSRGCSAITQCRS